MILGELPKIVDACAIGRGEYRLRIYLNDGSCVDRVFDRILKHGGQMLSFVAEHFDAVETRRGVVAWGEFEFDPYAILWGGIPSVAKPPCPYAEVDLGGRLENCLQ